MKSDGLMRTSMHLTGSQGYEFAAFVVSGRFPCCEQISLRGQEELGCSDMWHCGAEFPGKGSLDPGGFTIYLGFNSSQMASYLDLLTANRWVDGLTRALLIDFTIFNANSFLMTHFSVRISCFAVVVSVHAGSSCLVARL